MFQDDKMSVNTVDIGLGRWKIKNKVLNMSISSRKMAKHESVLKIN